MLRRAREFLGTSVAVTALIGFLFLVVVIGPIVVWSLFNYLAPIFNLRQIHFTEAFALYVLINMLTGGFKQDHKCNGK